MPAPAPTLTPTPSEWSIRDLARTAGTTSRTLRHYHAVGLLEPSRTGANGTRYYDRASLLRLQRILLLRGFGLGLPRIAEVLAGERDAAAALRGHLDLLERERQRLERRIAAVRTTLEKTERGEPLMPDEMFDGFDHTRFEDEVTERWGEETYARGDAWWRGLSTADKQRFQRAQHDIAADFAAVLAAGHAAGSDAAQAIARRHYEWVRIGWQGHAPSAEAFAGLGEMYVADPRFAEVYDRHGEGTAAFVRDAVKAYAERNLE